MDAFETDVHSFVLRIWVEQTDEEDGGVRWRGHITHVPSYKRIYLRNLDEVTGFIELYLAEMGIKTDLRQLPRRRLKQRNRIKRRK